MSEEYKTSTNVSIVGQVISIDTSNAKYPKVVVGCKNGEYPLLMQFDFSDKLKLPSEGDKVYVAGHAGSREWNGKYFTGLRATFCKISQGQTKQEAPQLTPEQQRVVDKANSMAGTATQGDMFDDSDVPF